MTPDIQLEDLRPWALRVLYQVLADDDVPVRDRLTAARFVLERVAAPADGMSGADAAGDPDRELVELVESLRRRG